MQQSKNRQAKPGERFNPQATPSKFIRNFRSKNTDNEEFAMISALQDFAESASDPTLYGLENLSDPDCIFFDESGLFID
ncbi:MAG: hypothetical protein LW884_06955 [Bacteroidetes bacterium]|jgi:hypothetical protein|nr:hypothetical protein [Bacteroidota bacterium]